jgi:hypothetical protein
MDGDIRVKVTLNKRRTTAERAVTTAIHEVAHLIEMMSPASSATTLLSTLPRIKADSVSAVSGGHKGEQKFESDFASSYTGKMYHSHGSAGCSEYLSMALQAMMQGNKSAIMFAKADPHAFITTYAIMKGYHL